MKKAAVIFATTLIVILLIGKSTFADEHGKGNEKKNENGAQVTFQGDTKTVENKNKIMIKIKIQNHDRDDDDEDENEDEPEIMIHKSVIGKAKPTALGKLDDVIYEDEDLLVADKPAGMVVHDGAGEVGEGAHARRFRCGGGVVPRCRRHAGADVRGLHSVDDDRQLHGPAARGRRPRAGAERRAGPVGNSAPGDLGLQAA